jgi:hypothetical protein
MDKKKRASEHEHTTLHASNVKNEVPAMVTEIVEDISDTPDIVESEKAPQRESVRETTTVIPEAEKADEADMTELVNKSPEPTEKSKEVVQELFTKQHGGTVTEISIQPEKTSKALFLWAVVVIVAAVTTGLSLIFFASKKSGPAVVAPVPTPTSMAVAPTPTLLPAPDRSDITIKVLNGGGVAGAGTKMKTFLTEKGYKVSDVGNASEYTFEQTQISVKSGKDSILNLIKSDLTGTYTVGDTNTDLTADTAYDALVTVGKE